MALPMDQMDGTIWLDGKLVPAADAKIHVLSHGLHYASAVLEGERAYGGEDFQNHGAFRAAEDIGQDHGLRDSLHAAEIDAAKRLVVEANKLPDCYIRAFAWRGSEMLGVSAQDNTIHLAIACWDWPDYFDPSEKMKGIRMRLADYRRPDPRTIPALAKASGLYMICTISKHTRSAGLCRCDDAGLGGPRRRMHRREHLLRARTARCHTPIADCFLSGITRNTVIELAKRRGIEAIERGFMPDDLYGFSECFLTGSASEITPVSEIAQWRFTPGAITSQIIDDYSAEVAAEPEGGGIKHIPTVVIPGRATRGPGIINPASPF
ncbi:MAG: aminotransferase class IV [Gemmatales bacterium]